MTRNMREDFMAARYTAAKKAAKAAANSDRAKFEAWLTTCPVNIRTRDTYAFGIEEVLFELPDERDD
jgi:hypothetical protein